MLKKKYIRDPSSCRELWKKLLKPIKNSDSWEFRNCFQKHYKNPLCFMLLEDNQGIQAMLPLSYLESKDQYVFFPGETWNYKTWLERTPFYCRNPQTIMNVFSECPENTYLRYIRSPETFETQNLEVDEIAYGLHPGRMAFDISIYFNRFTTKRLKEIKKEIAKLTGSKAVYKINRLEDFDQMIEWNLERYHTNSYFFDARFRESFRELMYLLFSKGRLRMVSLIINGKTAAVDIGAVYKSTFTIYAGGTNPIFPGAAKVINMYHIESAFYHKFSNVDFLCGDFNWKKFWHLDSEPLFKFVNPLLKNKTHTYRIDSKGYMNSVFKQGKDRPNGAENRLSNV
ncbi:MAG: GNAT family N-acetyltransferase [Desulfobacterales bacterium]|nr:GNAT family N-acetyltransferase [Desulfobacterales bacterium]